MTGPGCTGNDLQQTVCPAVRVDIERPIHTACR